MGTLIPRNPSASRHKRVLFISKELRSKSWKGLHVIDGKAEASETESGLEAWGPEVAVLA